MNKYNLKRIMKRAWEIKKENLLNIFSICLTMAWAEAKAPKEYRNVVIRQYKEFNSNRYSNPWVSEVSSMGRPDFAKKVGAYTGAYNKGEEGSLYVYTPVNGKVYAYGQKDYRGKNGGYEYVQFMNGTFINIDKKDLLKLIAA